MELPAPLGTAAKADNEARFLRNSQYLLRPNSQPGGPVSCKLGEFGHELVKIVLSEGDTMIEVYAVIPAPQEHILTVFHESMLPCFSLFIGCSHGCWLCFGSFASQECAVTE